jgi:serine/threonine-protein kinase RsbW
MSNKTKHNASVKIPSSTDRLSDVREFVGEQARVHGFTDDDVNKITLAVDEACTNIIKHGYNYSPDHFIEVMISREGGTFEITIADQGKKFDPNSIESPDMKEYLTHYRRGGLGIYLMKRIMDNVEFSFHRDRNILRMTKIRQ